MPQKISRIYLTGFMGSGKSSLGCIVANTIGYGFYDLDKEIENSANKKITDIFKDSGESYFRDLEAETLVKVSKSSHIVVALGGGAVLRKSNLDLTKSTGKLVYLRSSASELYNRLKFKTDRPLFQTVDNVIISEEDALNKIKLMMAEREPIYNQADIVFDTDNKTLGMSVDSLKNYLEKHFEISYEKN